MVLAVKQKFSIYKRFEKDIWGLSFSGLYENSTLTDFFFDIYLNKENSKFKKEKRYVYRVDVINPSLKRKFLKSRFIKLRLLKLFYLTLSYKQYRNYALMASRKDGFFQYNYCFFLEGRLISLIYRTNFISNIFEIIEYIKKKKVKVNGKVLSYVNENIAVGDILTLGRVNLYYLRYNFIKRLLAQGFIFNTPRYLYVNYKLFFAIMERQPCDADLAFPIKLDIYRATGYY